MTLAVLVSCGGGGGGNAANNSPAQAAAAPTALRVTGDPTYGTYLTLNWTRPTELPDGYELEYRLGNDTYQRINQTLIPPTYTTTYVDLTGAPEQSDHSFRLRAVKGSAYSAYTNEAPFHRGLKIPSLSLDTYSKAGSILLTLTNNSLKATAVLLERGVRVSPSSINWSPIPGITLGTTQFTDTGFPEASEITYRLTYSNGSDSGQTTSYPFTTGLATPTSLTVTPLVEGTQLSWANPSAQAEEVVVMRAQGIGTSYPSFQEIAKLPKGATSYSDLNLATGFYTYCIENRKTGLTSGRGNSVEVATLPPTGGISLKPQVLSLPDGLMVRRSLSGNWFFGGNNSSNLISIKSPTAQGWTDYLAPNADQWYQPFFLLDSKDLPHLVFLRSVLQGSNERAIIHSWFDGSDWKTEEIARRSLFTSNFGLTFILDKQDQLHLLWQKDTHYGSTQDLEYACKDQAGAWKIESLDIITPAMSGIGACRLFIDENSTPRVALSTWQNLLLLERSVSGTWTFETAPTGTISAFYNDFMEPLAQPGGTLSIFFCKSHEPYDGNSDLCRIQRTNGNWGSPQALTTVSSSGTTTYLASSPDASRIALYLRTAQGTKVFVQTDGAWTTTTTGPNQYTRPTFGFDIKNRFYLLERVGYAYSTTSNSTYVLFQEAP